jgi:uncharacterized glyoxalase superfamily protein PhnB
MAAGADTLLLHTSCGELAHLVQGSNILFTLVRTQFALLSRVLRLQDKSCGIKLVIWRSDSNHLCGMAPGVDGDCPEDEAFLQRAFGDSVPEWMRSQISQQLLAQDASSLGSIVSCSAFHTAGGVVLLGDSAHSVTSTLGQGCNMALESVAVFQELLERSVLHGEMPLADVPEAFTAKRLPDVRAMQRMEELSGIAQGAGDSSTPPWDALHSKVAFGSAMLLGTLQWKLCPSQFAMIPLYRMLYDEHTPYSHILAYINYTAAGMYVVLAVAMASVAYNFVHVLP